MESPGTVWDRGTLLPDPRYDAVRCIVLAAADDAEDMSSGTCATRVLLLDDKGRGAMDGLSNVQASAAAPPLHPLSCGKS